MAAMDTLLARRWAIQKLQAAAALTTLIANAKVYRGKVARSADTKQKPGLAVSIHKTYVPVGAIRSGAKTSTGTPLVLMVKAVQQADSTTQIEEVGAQVILALDGQGLQATTGGDIISCLKADDMQYEEYEGGDGDVVYQHLNIFFDITANATS